MLILLDGSKGAGKSSTSDILVQKLDNTVSIGFDKERKALANQDRVRKELNKEASEKIVTKSEESLLSGKNVIVDCGLTDERIIIFEDMARRANTGIYKFFLKAPKHILLERVRERDKSKNKETDVERFNQVFDIVHSKEFKDFHIIETENVDSEEVANKVLAIVS